MKHLAAALVLACACPQLLADDHDELEVSLNVPYQSSAVRRIELGFTHPGWQRGLQVQWQLEVRDAQGKVWRSWRGTSRLTSGHFTHTLLLAPPSSWPAGIYNVILRAGLGKPDTMQSWPMRIGQPGPRAWAAPSTLDQQAVYYGNLHSQTNHSDGGGALPACDSAQAPQTGALGPSDAYAYAQAHGLDLLMTSEHNHLYDGSIGTNPDADPDSAIVRYHNGLQQADRYTASHPGFLALYGMEWGVIDNGGHLNIFNADQLLGWEINRDNKAFADIITARNDYAGLYTLMQQRGWIGQFNHPASSGQFVINGQPLAYTAAGDEVMVLCEVLNTSAFSHQDQEAETRRTNFEPACQRLLEAGYHLAFSSDQDNHCANWGAVYSNRTAVVLPAGTALTRASFLQALRARSVFATMDKQARLFFSANGHPMGERFDNSGPLQLGVEYANSGAHRPDRFELVEGIPGQPGSTQARDIGPSATFTPLPGAHFYYIRVTQDDGKQLWSAPVWVTQKQQ